MKEAISHEHPLLHFNVEIEEKPSKGPNGAELKYSAVVTFFNDLGKKTEVHEMPCIKRDDIYAMIENGQDITLDRCYVYDFCLAEIRSSKGLNENDKILLKNFSAKKTFFDCETMVDFSYSQFDGDKISFESAVFGNGIVNFAGADFGHGDVSFKRTRFGDGKINFQYVEFGTGNISFQFSNFGNGDVSFINTDFSKGNVDFKSVMFGEGNVDFKFAKFSHGDVSFEKAIFGKGNKDFKAVEFGGGKVDFRRASFGDGDVSFEGVEFGNGKVSFKSASFGSGDKTFEIADFGSGDASFEQVDFGSGNVSFNNCKVTDISFRSCQLNVYMDLRFGHCNSIDLSDTIVRDIIDLKPQQESVNISILNISSMRNLGRIYIDWKANNVYNLIYNQKNTTLYQKAEQFRILKEDFNTTGQYNDEDLAYVEFKRCEERGDLEAAIKENKNNVFWALPLYRFKWLVFYKMGKYATDPMRVITSMSVVFTIFSIHYYFMTIFTDSIIKMGDNPAGLFECFYYSAITFLTIGYGDFLPYGTARIFASLEGFTGVFLMSYFTVAFVRKILR